MKKVVKDIIDSITVDQVSCDKWYGMINSKYQDNYKGFIANLCIGCGKNRYRVHYIGQQSYSSDGCEYTQLKPFIRDLINNEHTVLEFDTPQELFTWLGARIVESES